MVKAWINGKLSMLFNPYYEMLLSGMIHLCLLCLIHVFDVISLLCKCPSRHDMLIEVMILICICMIYFRRLK